MVRFSHSSFVVAAVLILLVCAPSTLAQESPAALVDGLTQARAALVESAEEVRRDTQELLVFKEKELAVAERKHEQLRQLFAEGLLAARALEEDERALAGLRASMEDLRRQIADSERVIAEVAAAEEAEKAAKLRPTAPASRVLKTAHGYRAASVIIRHTGSAGWTAANLSGIQSFFASTFGRTLPVSAHGQTTTHTRLGYDHSRAVDVALHPDSAEGRALINYLQSRGITFIAFRAAVPGSATGAHIHIGPPSHRIG